MCRSNEKIINISVVISFVFTFLWFTGCASSVSYKIRRISNIVPENFKIIDEIPEKQKEAEVMSVNKNNCFFGIYKIGDSQIPPGRMDILSRGLYKIFVETKIDPTEITVQKFEIYNNYQRRMRQMILAASFGMAKKHHDEMDKKGLCNHITLPKINPENHSAIVILLDITYKNKFIHKNIVQINPIITGKETVRSPTVEIRLNNAFRELFNQLTVDILKIT